MDAAAKRERLRDNRFGPRPLNGARRATSRSTVRPPSGYAVMIGATGLSGLFWPGGEIAAARAAAAAGTGYCLSHASVCTIEEMPRQALRRAGCRFSFIAIAASRANSSSVRSGAGYDGLC